MGTERLAAFSDGVIAVIITIMVLELKAPHEADPAALLALAPAFCAYVLSFVYVAIYWNNHHHLFQLVHRASGGVLWANLHLLFWLSLIPFSTSWVGEHGREPAPMAVYGFVLLMSAIAWWILQMALLRTADAAPLRQAIGQDFKGKVSPVLYLVGILAAFWIPWVSALFYIAVALMWFIPDRRMERLIGADPTHLD